MILARRKFNNFKLKNILKKLGAKNISELS
jgi:hypothetical protein